MVFLNVGGKKVQVVFTNVLYAPRLVKNLFSLKQVIFVGHTIEFEKIYCMIKSSKRSVMAKGEQTNKLYKLKCEILVATKIALVANNVEMNNFDLQYQCHNHLNDGNVNLLFEGCKWDIMSHTRPLG
jgi:hypothetical protein